MRFNSHIIGFDDYYLSLRPRMGDECGGQTESNVPHKFIKGKMVNCRNIWFREFWSQHHKCTFSVNASSGVTRCTGEENLVDYEQEGLVPFVGNVLIYFIVILTLFSKRSFYFYVIEKKKCVIVTDLHRRRYKQNFSFRNMYKKKSLLMLITAFQHFHLSITNFELRFSWANKVFN